MTYDEAEKYPDSHSLRHILLEGCKNPDLDEAVLGVQAVLGIQSGDGASVFFSGMQDEYAEWKDMQESDRFSVLHSYAAYELNCDLVGAFKHAQEQGKANA